MKTFSIFSCRLGSDVLPLAFPVVGSCGSSALFCPALTAVDLKARLSGHSSRVFVMNWTYTGPLDGCKMLMHSNLCPSGQHSSQQTDSKFHCLFLCLPNCELECKSPSACIVFPPRKQPAVPISLARLRQGSATCSPKLLLHLPMILSMTSTHHRFIFFPFLSVVVLVSSSPAHIPYPPSCFYLFLQQGQPCIHGFFFYATWHSREIPRDTLFLLAEGTPRCGTAKKSLDLHCRKCVLAPVWNMLKPGRISWAFRW